MPTDTTTLPSTVPVCPVRGSVIYPSMVQHMGVLTSGLGFHHTSDCYMADYPSLR